MFEAAKFDLAGHHSVDRRRLERSGWRTNLEFRENLRRGRDGRLLGVDPVWIAEAERIDADGVQVLTARADRAAGAWAVLWRHVRDRDRLRGADLGLRELAGI